MDEPLGLTRTGVIAGTLSYMAPEQVKGKAAAIGPAADVHSLSVILYEVLVGRPPFQAETPMETIMQVLHDEPVPVKRLRPNVARDLETVTLECLQKEPARRYAGCLELAEDLRWFLAGEPIKATPPSLFHRFVRIAQRDWAIVGGIAATVLALVCGTLVSILLPPSTPTARGSPPAAETEPSTSEISRRATS